MANHNATVTYVEPNNLYDSLDQCVGGNVHYDRAPDLEDFCMAMNIGVEVSSREDGLRKIESDNKVLILAYKDNGTTSSISFLCGTKIGTTKDTNGNDVDYRALTTGPMDMYVTDLVDYGTTEMIGIKSINIDYNSSEVPMVTVQFTDVRGMSLFQPKELNYDNSFNGIRGLSKGNIAQTFFQCFFDLPLPKFTIQLKGFYGKSVTYQMACQKFDTKFNSATGDFDITCVFIGFRYSFMTDISFSALLAAPYSDYFGEKYWESQVNEGRFKLRGKNGEPQDMPRLYDIRENWETLFKQANEDFQVSSMENEEKHHTIEIEELRKLRDTIKGWYETFSDILQTKFGKDMVYLFKNGEGYDRILLLTNNKDFLNGDMGNLFPQLDDDFKQKTIDLYAMIEKYNEKADSYSKIKNLNSNDLSLYQSQRIFRKIYVNVDTSTFVFDGFDPGCDLPRDKTIKTVFPNGNEQAKLRKFYHDGIDQYIYGFVIELDYSGVDNRIQALEKDANMSDDERTKREKIRLYNQSMFSKMTWYPTIENFTRIVVAHLETLMAMMYNVTTKVSNTGKAGRTVADLGMSLENCSDVNPTDDAEKQFIPPFPRVTKLVTGDDGITKKEDAWIGEFGVPGGEIPEVDMINGLFNAVNKIQSIEANIQAVVKQNEREDVNLEDKACVVKYPTTPYDFYIKKNIYGSEDDAATDIYSFIGKVCFRMFDVLAINTFRYQFGNTWTTKAEDLGKIEAMNFHNLIKLKNTNIFKAINTGGEFENADKAWDVITGNYTGMTAENCPWGGGSLFTHDGNTDGIWLDKYKSKNNEWIYPAQNFNFGVLDESKKQVDSGVYPNENDDIILSDISNPRTFLTTYLKSGENNAFFNFIIEENRKKFNEAIAAATSSSNDDAYATISKDYIEKAIAYNADGLKTIFATDDQTNSTGFSPSSFVDKLPDNVKQSGGLNSETYHKYYHLSSSAVDSYVASEDNGEVINNISLSEVFGIRKNSNGKYSIDKNLSYFHHGGRANYELITNNSDKGRFLSQGQFETAMFLFGITGINYANVKKLFENNSFIAVPKIVALQVGAMLAIMAYNNVTPTWSITGYIGASDLELLRKVTPLPSGIVNMCDTINRMNVLGKMYLIKYFMKWADANYAKIVKITNSGYHYINTADFTDKNTKFENRRVVILRQNKPEVQQLTIQLLSIVIIVRGNVNSFKKIVAESKDTSYRDASGAYVVRTETQKIPSSLTRNDCKVTKADVINYLNAFLDKLRQLNGIGDENGSLTQLAKTPDKTTDDMKMELYRYLKQIYDKWIPTTDMKDWKIESFFGDPKDTSDAGHQFHFIDSYYNKMNHKLLINPKKISTKIANVLATVNTAGDMQGFIADIYGQHRCFFKCIQNFADLGDKKLMDKMFVPVPYNEMGGPKIHPDFVVIYTYEPSKNLNIDNGEFKDDGFMLNDEMETPVAIRTRRTDRTDGYYYIPAFGVAYGKQYQNYFKNVSVNMSSPIQTQQAINAKHAILQASRSEQSKTVTAQDFYDIYSTQSYTCDVEMMGCAWVQPMMYFVLLNVPMFRGSYMIMKVNHTITPGNMVTKFTGCRMANVGNRFVQDIFSDEEVNGVTGDLTTAETEKLADVNNDCPYKVYPLVECGEGPDMSAELGNQITTKDCGNTTSYNYVSGNSIKQFVAKIAENEAGTGAGVSELHQMLVITTIYNRRIHDGNWKGVFTHGQYDLKKAKDKAGSSTTQALVENIFKNSPSYILGKYSKTTCKRGESGSSQKKLTKTGKSGKYFKAGETLHASELTVEKLSTIICFVNYHELDGTYKRNPWVEKQQAVLVHDSTDNGAFGHSFNSTDDSKSYWKSDNKKTDPSITNENIAKLLFDAIQKSLASTNASAALKFAHGADDKTPSKPLVITQQDGKCTHLAKVFDIVLNTPEYYKHVQALYWGYKQGGGVQTADPQAVIIDAVLQPDENRKQIYAVQMTGEATFNEGTKATKITLSKDQKPEEVVSKNLLLSLSKKYADVNSNFNKLSKDCPQFTTVDLFKDTSVTNCSTMMSGNAAGPGSNSTWAKAVQTMGKWYEANVHTYQKNTPPSKGSGSRKAYNCDLVGGNVYDDCSGYVSACLQYFGTFNKGFVTTSAGFTTDSGVASKLEKGNFKKLSYSWDTVQPYDIISYCGHVEILAEKGETPKSWGWGSVHDGKTYSGKTRDVMPAKTGNKPKGNTYKVIWRYMG